MIPLAVGAGLLNTSRQNSISTFSLYRHPLLTSCLLYLSLQWWSLACHYIAFFMMVSWIHIPFIFPRLAPLSASFAMLLTHSPLSFLSDLFTSLSFSRYSSCNRFLSLPDFTSLIFFFLSLFLSSISFQLSVLIQGLLFSSWNLTPFWQLSYKLFLRRSPSFYCSVSFLFALDKVSSTFSITSSAGQINQLFPSSKTNSFLISWFFNFAKIVCLSCTLWSDHSAQLKLYNAERTTIANLFAFFSFRIRFNS